MEGRRSIFVAYSKRSMESDRFLSLLKNADDRSSAQELVSILKVHPDWANVFPGAMLPIFNQPRMFYSLHEIRHNIAAYCLCSYGANPNAIFDRPYSNSGFVLIAFRFGANLNGDLTFQLFEGPVWQDLAYIALLWGRDPKTIPLNDKAPLLALECLRHGDKLPSKLPRRMPGDMDSKTPGWFKYLTTLNSNEAQNLKPKVSLAQREYEFEYEEGRGFFVTLFCMLARRSYSQLSLDSKASLTLGKKRRKGNLFHIAVYYGCNDLTPDSVAAFGSEFLFHLIVSDLLAIKGGRTYNLLPSKNYEVWIEGVWRVQFLTPLFIEGAIKACKLLGHDYRGVLTSLIKIDWK